MKEENIPKKKVDVAEVFGIDTIMEVFAFGVLMPMAVSGILFMFYAIIFEGVTANIACGICY